MDVRERDDGLDDGDLLGGLSFTDVEPFEPPPPARAGLWRVLSWLLVLALVVGGGLLGLRWWSDRDVRAVLASSGATFEGALDDLAQARDATALATAAASLPVAADRLDADAARLDRDGGGRRAAVVAQVEAERDVLRALEPLSGLGDGPLRVWGQAHAGIADALDAEARTRAVLRQRDSGAAGRLPDTALALRRIATTVGAALVVDVQRSAGEVLDELAAAERTADLRAAAEQAAAQRSAVAAAQTGLAGTADAQVLGAFAAALDAVRALEQLSPADTSAWPAARSALAERLRAVAEADDGLVAGSVRARLPLVLEAVDRLVARAAQAHADWQPVHDAAVAQQAGDRAALARYAESVRATGTEWTALREQVTALSGSDPSTAAAVQSLAPLSDTAQRLLGTLQRSTPPDGVGPAHAGLVTAVEPLAATLVTVLDELRDAACQDCPAADVPGWPALARGADRSASWGSAVTAWERAVTDADAAVAARQLPPPPDA